MRNDAVAPWEACSIYPAWVNLCRTNKDLAVGDRPDRVPSLWTDLRRFTAARVALGRVGNGLPTRAQLDFQAAHAAARDAVHAVLDVPALRAQLSALGLPSLAVHSAATDRHTYLLRPDLGRQLRSTDRAALSATLVAPAPGQAAGPAGAMLFVICDGLSAIAVQRHAPAVLARVIPALQRAGQAIAPIVVAEQGRVALGDDIGEVFGAAAVAVLIGERPGLTAADSLGVYLTWQPRRGRTDAERNCISNIRPDGLSPQAAATKLLWLIGAMRRLRLTGIGLKDDAPITIATEPPPERGTG